MVVPVMKELWSDPRNHAAFPISVGSVTLPIGNDCSNWRRFSSPSTPVPVLARSLKVAHISRCGSSEGVAGKGALANIDVFPTAGQMQLNRIVGAYSNAIVLVATYELVSRCVTSRIQNPDFNSSLGSIIKCEPRSRPSTASATNNPCQRGFLLGNLGPGCITHTLLC